MKKPILIFDLGNVIINFDHVKAVNKFVNYSHLTKKEFISKIRHSKTKRLHEKGLISNKTFFNGIKKELSLEIGRKTFEKIWCRIFDLNKNVYNFVRLLRKKRYKIAILSDTNALHDKYEISKYRIDRISDFYLPSYKLNEVKAEGVKIFKKALKILKTKPANAIFVDDLKRNIKYAKKAGIYSIQFKGLRALKRELRGKGIVF